MSEKILGIDLGTTNSAVAIIDQGHPKLISDSDESIIPSVVGIAPNGEVLVGKPARNQWVVAPENTVRSIKRKMGRTDKVSMAGKLYTPQEISAFILRELKQRAERACGIEINRAVITVPAYFNELQRQATIEAGAIAGLQVERIINEPTASALAYGLGKDEDLRVLVYDLGGGTFDVSVIEMSAGVIDVRATAGNNHLGGDDFDERLANLLADEFKTAHQIDLRENHQAWARLLRSAEEAKIELSAAPYAIVSLEYIAEDSKKTPLHIRRELEREEFEALIEDSLISTMALIDKALKDADLTAEDIDRVLLVGGSTRIPAVWQLITEHMKQQPHIEIDPDAAVALGASVQAAIIAKEDIDAILVDVTPMSLGIEAAHINFMGQLQTDRFVPLIRRNTTIPVRKSEQFSTLMPGQDKIHIKVYQGEESVASRNTMLGDFMVEDLKPNRGDGLTDVIVNFTLDINGILDVAVADRKGSVQARQQLKASRQRLSPTEIALSQEKLNQSYKDEEDEDSDVIDIGDQDEDFDGDEAIKTDVTFDPGTAALISRAQAALENPELSEELFEQIKDTMANIRQEQLNDNYEKVNGFCDELIDLLMAAEE